MKPLSELHMRVCDKGLFLPLARRLAREVGKVTYWSPEEEAFKTLRSQVGDGFPDIERVRSIFFEKEGVDVFVFPDIGFADEQAELRDRGFPVWGARGGDVLEEMRGKFLKTLATTDLPVPPHITIVGLTALCNFLQDKTEKWVKVSRWRGDWETLHFRDWQRDETELDARAVKLGPWKELLTFYVFDEIETEIEDGMDSYCIDGQFPSLVVHGMEAKDTAFLGTFQAYNDVPKEVRCVSDAFGPILAGYQYRSFFSSEVRITKDHQSFFIDPTCRAGSPPHQAMCEMIGNLAEIVWQGAQGNLVEPVPHYQFGVQAIVNLAGDRRHWQVLPIAADLDNWLKCGNCMWIDGALCFPPEPQPTDHDIGWLVGVGDTAEEAIEHLQENIELLPDGATCECHHLAELLEEAHEAEGKGMPFSDQPLPDPEVALDK